MVAELTEVAKWATLHYDGGMPSNKYQTPDDFPAEMGFSDAYSFLVMSGAQISEATFARMIRAGRVRKYPRKLIKRPFYRKSELQALLNEGETPPPLTEDATGSE